MLVENAFLDLPYDETAVSPDSFPLNIISGGHHLYGYLLKPDSRYKAPYPTVIMFHGFPGYTTNNDLEYALMRMGCVVIHVNHTGAWGSEGNYLFSNLKNDSVAIAKWAHNRAITEQFEIDENNIFIAGHSMGGMTVLNAAKDLPFVRGVVAMAPYDLASCFHNKLEKELFLMIEIEGQCLKMTSASEVFENALDYYNELSVFETHNHLKNHNVLLIGAEKDIVAPPELMCKPLYNKLVEESPETTSYVSLKANHAFGGMRVTLANTVGSWIKSKLV